MQSLRLGELQIDRVIENEGPFAALDFLLPDAPPDLVERNADWLKPRFVDPASGQVVMSFQAFLVRTPRSTILVDACIGNDKERPHRPNWHRQRGPFLERLAATGVRPEQIDYVCCTHLHADHVGWNTRLADGRWVPTFPNARYIFARKEYDHWEAAHRAAVAAGAEPVNHGAFADSVLPVVEAGRAVLVESDHEIEKGIHLEPAYGHTPGTCMIHAKSGGDHGVFIGDMIHTPAQLGDPSVSSRFCDDPAASARSRIDLCERYADTPTRILAAHFPACCGGGLLRHRGAFKLDA